MVAFLVIVSLVSAFPSGASALRAVDWQAVINSASAIVITSRAESVLNEVTGPLRMDLIWGG